MAEEAPSDNSYVDETTGPRVDPKRMEEIFSKNWFAAAMVASADDPAGIKAEMQQFAGDVKRVTDEIHRHTLNERPDVLLAALITLMGEHVLSAAGLALRHRHLGLAETVQGTVRTLQELSHGAMSMLFGTKKGPRA